MLLKGIAAVSAVLAAVSAFDGNWWMVPVYFVACFLVLLLVALVLLFVVSHFVDLEKPQEHDSKFYRTIMYPYIELLMQIVGIRLHTEGLEKTPGEGRFLLVCNHLHAVDPGILLHCFKKSQLAFISKKENMELPVINAFMHKIMCQMLERDNDRQGLKVILKCIQLIKDDEVSIGVFPEGYTSIDGKIHHFRSGVFKIAQKANVPIAVCTIQGTRKLQQNIKKLKRTDVHLHLVDVIPAEELKGKSTVEISDRIYETMIGDLGENWREKEE